MKNQTTLRFPLTQADLGSDAMLSFLGPDEKFRLVHSEGEGDQMLSLYEHPFDVFVGAETKTLYALFITTNGDPILEDDLADGGYEISTTMGRAISDLQREWAERA